MNAIQKHKTLYHGEEKMIHIAVCEDDYVYREIIQSILESNITIPFDTDFFSSGTDFLNTLAEEKCSYSVLITDIDLGPQSVSGIAVAKELNVYDRDTQIIFISQYLEFVSDVYETSHLYFINKQRIREYLPKALRAAHKQYSLRADQYLYIQSSYREYRILQEDILYLEHMARQTYIHTDSQIFSANEKLQDLLDRLGTEFCSCHKSFAVNLSQIQTLHHTCIVLRNGSSIPVSRSRYPHVRDAFGYLATCSRKENFYD